MERITAVVPVSWSYFELIDEAALGDITGTIKLAGDNGLVRPRSHGVQVITGVYYGVASVQVEVITRTEQQVDIGPWEDVAECSATFASTALVLTDPEHTGDPLTQVTLPRSGSYRVRVSCSGRDIAFDSGSSTPDEEYLIQIWPAEASSASQLKLTSDAGNGHANSAPTPPRADRTFATG